MLKRIIVAMALTVGAVAIPVVATAPAAQAQTCGNRCDGPPYGYTNGCYRYVYDRNTGYWGWRLECV